MEYKQRKKKKKKKPINGKEEEQVKHQEIEGPPQGMMRNYGKTVP
jgi:hypothetical protein